MWHDHFATAESKVDDLALMRRQNETVRRLARAPFGTLLGASIREPALLLYLDAPSNRKDHPNENLARELMELFTVGIGNYAEADVKEAARALTGWTLDDGAFREAPAKHDDGEKTLFGRKGRVDGADLLATLLERPAGLEGWPGGSAASSWARGPSTSRRSVAWPANWKRAASTSAARSSRCSARGHSLPRRTSARG